MKSIIANIHIYVYIYIYIYIHTHIYIYTHTYIQTAAHASTHSLFSTRNDLGDMQLTLHSVFPCSLHIVMENLP